MKDDYLWDGRGEPDPEIAGLEQVLRSLRHRGGRLPLDARHREAEADRSPRRPEASTGPGLEESSGDLPGENPPATRTTWRGAGVMLALAAALVLLVRATVPNGGDVQPAGGLAGVTASRNAAPSAQWIVEIREGTHPEGKPGAAAELRPDAWIVTGAGSRARLRADPVGVVDVEPGSRIRLVESGEAGHRFALARGVLHAFIWATPGQFSVETPSATAIDLGCAYTLEVDEDGSSRVRVTAGWVGLAQGQHESFVPAGASCATRAGHAPGTPRLDDASPAFARALDALDAPGTSSVMPAALDAVLGHARREDAFSLWHVLGRVPLSQAPRVYNRLAELAPPPAGVTSERVLARDREALDAWWDSLGLGDTSWYRTFRAGSAR